MACIIVYNPNGKQLDQWVADNCVCENPDGFGFVDLTTGELTKTMDIEQMYHLMLQPIPYIAHCRYATRGAVSDSNIHPFDIEGTDWVLFMNGTLCDLVDTEHNDTEQLAFILMMMPQENWEVYCDMLDVRCLLYNRVTKEVITTGDWGEYGGMMFSNSRPHTVKAWKPVKGSAKTSLVQQAQSYTDDYYGTTTHAPGDSPIWTPSKVADWSEEQEREIWEQHWDRWSDNKCMCGTDEWCDLHDCGSLAAYEESRRERKELSQGWYYDDGQSDWENEVLEHDMEVGNTTLVAVYGTLKQGHGNHRLLTGATFVGLAHTDAKYRLCVEGLPYVIRTPHKNGHCLPIEVYRVNPKELADLDSLEGHPNFYRRERVDCTLDTGQKIDPWIYMVGESYDTGIYAKSYSPSLGM